MNRKVIFVCLCLIAAVIEQAQAQERPRASVHELVRPSVVYLTLSGFSDAGSVETSGTGVVVTSDGLALTSYHILEPILATQQEGRELRARLGFKTGQEHTFTIVNADKDRDFALIKLSDGLGDFAAVCFSTERFHRGLDVFTTGFPEIFPVLDLRGPIASFDGERGTIVAQFGAPAGMSGSPVFQEDGVVRGFVKGSFSGAEPRNAEDDNGGLLSAIVPLSGVAGLPAPDPGCAATSRRPGELELIEIGDRVLDAPLLIDQPNAEVVLSGNLEIGSNSVNIRAARLSAENVTIISFPIGQTATAGARGETGQSGDDAPSRSGQRGRDGGNGSPGGSGVSGKNGGSVRLVAEQFVGRLAINTSGEAGGDGGIGGDGGDGGSGAAGQNAVDGFLSCNSGPGNGGDGGNAGSGGDGGNGGDGGDAGRVEIEFISVATDASLQIVAEGGLAGLGADGGRQGRPGKPGPRGPASTFCSGAGRGEGSPGRHASSGVAGQTGEAGSAAPVELLIGSQKSVTTGRASFP
jgi:hypothetical protein